MNTEREPINVIFRKFPEGDVIALLSGYECNLNMIMSYMHIGQHGEASIDLIDELDTCTNQEIKALLDELTSIGYDVTVNREYDIVDNGDDYGYDEQKNFD